MEMLTSNETGNNYFGFELGYDKITNAAGRNFQEAQFNGNINGLTWKSKTDNLRRQYNFSYDAVSRLLKADYLQNDAGAIWGVTQTNFSTRMGDGINPASAYDANGNIKKMSQMGLTLSGPQKIDSLSYTYLPGSNKLQKVNDAITVDHHLGDFIDKNTGNDYGYDLNGNMIVDLNKGLRGPTGDSLINGGAITYNYMNLPEVIQVKDTNNVVKGTITYKYDRRGNKYLKQVEDKTVSGKTITTATTYLGGIIYETRSTIPADINTPDYTNRLQFISHEEGRIRLIPSIEQVPAKYTYDYFLKDYLGNTRMVLSEKQQLDIYPIASLEGDPNNSSSAISINNAFYQIDPVNVVDTAQVDGITAYQNNNGIATRISPGDSSQHSAKVYKLQAVGGAGVTGLGIALKVTGGDKVSLLGKSYYKVPLGSVTNYQVPVLALLEGLLGAGSVAVGKGVTTSELNGVAGITGAITNFLSDSTRGGP